jgi:hypothetical protein
MNKSESIKELAGALAKFQGDVSNPKNTASNPQFNSKYAPLQDILSMVRPLLSKQGLSVVQSTAGDLENVTISTMLLHESGEYLGTNPFVLKGEQTLKGGAKVLNIQGAGSMITYVRRYQLSAILGLSSEDDDDGNHASISKPTAQKPVQEKPVTPVAQTNPLPAAKPLPTAVVCSECGAAITEKVAKYSTQRLGRPLCFSCQKSGTPEPQSEDNFDPSQEEPPGVKD